MISVNEAMLLQEIEKLHKKVEIALTLLQARPVAELKELYSSLAQAQAEYRPATRSKATRMLKTRYEKLEDVVRASRPALAVCGLSARWTQSATLGGGSLIRSTLAHTP